jgi:hypothetical protein
MCENADAQAAADAHRLPFNPVVAGRERPI